MVLLGFKEYINQKDDMVRSALTIVLILLGVCQSELYSSENRYFEISEGRQFLLSEKIDPQELEDLKSEPFLAISLGHTCWPAAHLQDHALRKRSFPFDWMTTTFDSIYKLIETDFYGFLDLRHMGRNFTSTIHGAQFSHDFKREEWSTQGLGIVPKTEKAATEYKKMLSRYERRIARFYKVFELGIPIYLFRWNIQQQQAYQLYDLLKRKFPNSTIYLICLQHNTGRKIDEDWGHPQIKHFSIGWDGKSLVPFKTRTRNPEWTRVFEALGLLTFQFKSNDFLYNTSD